MLMDCVISPSVRVSCNGLDLLLLFRILFACKSVIVLLTWNVRLGFGASGYLRALAAGSTHARGCIIFFRPTLSLLQSRSESDGRFLLCEFRFCNQVFRVCCVYAPNSNPARNQFLGDVSVSIDPSVPTVLAGDFKCFKPVS